RKPAAPFSFRHLRLPPCPPLFPYTTLFRSLLYHAPHRYLDATTVTPLARAHVGEEVTCVGRVVSTGVLPTRKGLRVFRAVLRDASGLLECAWPGQPFLERQIKKGQLLLATG